MKLLLGSDRKGFLYFKVNQIMAFSPEYLCKSLKAKVGVRMTTLLSLLTIPSNSLMSSGPVTSAKITGAALKYLIPVCSTGVWSLSSQRTYCRTLFINFSFKSGIGVFQC